MKFGLEVPLERACDLEKARLEPLASTKTSLGLLKADWQLRRIECMLACM